ncbi:MAG: Sec-independent protein translocase protein TatB [Pacificimonas sp.]
MPFFDLGSMELLLIAIVALIVVGPKDLPKLMRAAGQMMAKLRGTARHFKSGVDEMIRQAELEEMQAKWEQHNQSIMTGPPMPETDGADDPAPEKRASGAAESRQPEPGTPAPDATKP